MELGIVFLEFRHDSARLGHRIDALIKRRHVYHMQQQSRTLQMSKKQVPNPRTLRCALDEARHIGDDKALFRSHANHAQVGVQGCEWVVRYLRASIGYRGNQR